MDFSGWGFAVPLLPDADCAAAGASFPEVLAEDDRAGAAGSDGGALADGWFSEGPGAVPAGGASMISAAAPVVGVELGNSGGPVATETDSPGRLAPGAAGPAATLKEGPAAPGFRISVAEMASSGGLRFGLPRCAASETSGEDLTNARGIFNGRTACHRSLILR